MKVYNLVISKNTYGGIDNELFSFTNLEDARKKLKEKYNEYTEDLFKDNKQMEELCDMMNRLEEDSFKIIVYEWYDYRSLCIAKIMETELN